MLGAVIGDLIGSVYEHQDLKGYSLPLISPLSRHTDDTVILLACNDALENKKPISETLREWFWMYRDCGFSPSFENWCLDEGAPPNNSNGNGAAIRGIVAGLRASDFDEVKPVARMLAACSHGTEEALNHAEAVASVIFFSRFQNGSDYIDRELRKAHGIWLGDIPSFDELHKNYGFDSTCSGSVPIAIKIGLEATSFEDCMRKGLYVGGDTDTILCIAGAICAQKHKIPEGLIVSAIAKLPGQILNIVCNGGGV